MANQREHKGYWKSVVDNKGIRIYIKDVLIIEVFNETKHDEAKLVINYEALDKFAKGVL